MKNPNRGKSAQIHTRPFDSSQLVGAIYDAAMEPEGWTDLLNLLREPFHASSGFLWVTDDLEPDCNVVASVHLSEKALGDYEAYYHKLDPGLPVLHEQGDGSATVISHLFDLKELEKTEYYVDCSLPSNVIDAMGGNIAMGNNRSAMIAVHRWSGQSPFSQKDLALFSGLMPHLKRATQIGRMFAREKNYRKSYETLLERHPYGVLLLDEEGKTVFATSRAERILSDQDGLSGGVAGIRAADPMENQLLRQLLRGVLATGTNGSHHNGGTMRISRPSGLRPYSVMAFPLPTRKAPLGLEGTGICAALVIHDESRISPPEPALLTLLYGLTSAEALLAVEMARGSSPGEIAERQEKSIHTVRAQLKSVFQKLDVNSQSQLVKRLNSGPFRTTPKIGEKP